MSDSQDRVDKRAVAHACRVVREMSRTSRKALMDELELVFKTDKDKAIDLVLALSVDDRVDFMDFLEDTFCPDCADFDGDDHDDRCAETRVDEDEDDEDSSGELPDDDDDDDDDASGDLPGHDEDEESEER